MAKINTKKKNKKRYRDQKKEIPVKTHFYRSNKYAVLILTIIPFVFYFSTYNYEFVLDDKIVLSENDFVQKGVNGIKEIFSNEGFVGFEGTQKNLVAGGRYRPLSLAMYAIEYEFFGLNPSGYHLINILIYALTGLIIFRVLYMFFRPPKEKAWYFTVPFIASLLFVMHPVHIEAVANIKGRDEILTLLFSFVTLFYIHRYITFIKNHFLLLAGVVFFIALMAKENAITFLAVIPLTLYLFTKATKKQYLAVMATILVATIVYLRIRSNVLGNMFTQPEQYTGIMNNPFLGMTFIEEYATIAFTLLLYIKLLFIPYPLTHDYYPYQIPIMDLGDWQVWLAIIVNLALLVYALLYIRKHKIIAWGILYYFITLFIASNIIFPVGTFMNERFLFMPSVGFILIIAFVLSERLPTLISSKKEGNYIISAALLVVMCIGFAVITYGRLPAWKDTLSLNQAAVKVSTNSARANNFMGVALYQMAIEEEDSKKRAEMLEEAKYYIDRSLSIYPEYSDALKMRAGIYGKLYVIDRDLDKLLKVFREILEVRYIEFIDEYLVYLNPRADKEKMLEFYHNTSFQLIGVEQKLYGLAVKHLQYALQLAPDSTTILEDMAIIYHMAGHPDKSQEYLQKALQINPDLTRAKEVMGIIN